MRLETVHRGDHQRCAVCHDGLEAEATACPLCDTALHPDCAEAVGRCPTLGCPVELVPVAPAPTFAEQMEARDGELVRRWAAIGATVGLLAGAALAGTPAPEVGPFWGPVGHAVVGAMQGALLGPIAGLFLRALTTGTPELGAERPSPTSRTLEPGDAPSSG